MVLYEDEYISKDRQRYQTKFRVTEVGNFYFRARAVDANGNSVLSDVISGISSERIELPAKMLIVYDNWNNFEANEYLKDITGTFERLGIEYDLWNTYFKGFIDYDEVMKDYVKGAVFWFTPDYCPHMSLTHENQLKHVVQYMDNGGSIFIAGQDIARSNSSRNNPEFLPEYLGSEFTASGINLFQLCAIIQYDPLKGAFPLISFCPFYHFQFMIS